MLKNYRVAEKKYPACAQGYMKAMGMTAVEVASKNYMDVSFCGRKNRFYYFGGRDEGSPSLIRA